MVAVHVAIPATGILIAFNAFGIVKRVAGVRLKRMEQAQRMTNLVGHCYDVVGAGNVARPRQTDVGIRVGNIVGRSTEGNALFQYLLMRENIENPRNQKRFQLGTRY